MRRQSFLRSTWLRSSWRLHDDLPRIPALLALRRSPVDLVPRLNRRASSGINDPAEDFGQANKTMKNKIMLSLGLVILVVAAAFAARPALTATTPAKACCACVCACESGQDCACPEGCCTGCESCGACHKAA